MKNGELSQSNSELRHKVIEMEYTVNDMKEKWLKQRHHLEHMLKSKKQVEENLEKMKVRLADKSTPPISRPPPQYST